MKRAIFLFVALAITQFSVAQQPTQSDLLIKSGRQSRMGTVLEIAGGAIPLLVIYGDHTGRTAISYKADNSPYFIASGILLGAGVCLKLASAGTMIKAGKAGNAATSAQVYVLPMGAGVSIRF